jgi:adenosine deaminase
VRDAIELLGADRIDHGVRAIEDPELVALLADRRIPLGVCPTSNLKLGVYAAIDAHPIDRLRRAGVAVSLNTDDPVLLGASLEGEYALCWQVATQRRTTSPFSEYRIATTSFCTAWSSWFLLIAMTMSSMAAMSSCSLMFMPLCVVNRSRPV